MKITFLGTGAADWELQHDLENPEFRRNSSALIDDVLLIDPGPCVPNAIESFGINVGKIKYVIFTHTHSDHYNESTVEYLKSHGAEIFDLSSGGEFEIGKYSITAMSGNHSIPVVHFIISDSDKKLFYALDSSWLLCHEFYTLRRVGADFAVLDSTIGFKEGDYRIFEHNNLRMVLEMKLTLSKYIKRFCISHMAKTLHGTHSELCDSMKPYGIEVARDGLTFEI